MNILWITNILFPFPSKYLGVSVPVVGGWMYSSAQSLVKSNSRIKLAVATVYCGDDFIKISDDNIIYYLLPLKKSNIKYNSLLEDLWEKLDNDFKIDIAHLHGTEFAHGLAFINACPKVKTLVSIQGLVSVIEKYYYSDISFLDLLKNITLRDLLRKDTIFQQKHKFYNRGLIEVQIIKRINHIIGRTAWDKAHVYSINPKAHYYFCNETLRSSFYNKVWSYENCEKHTIFISQGAYTIKGVHQVIKALPKVLSHFPDSKVLIAGKNIIDTSNWKKKLKLSGYGSYLKNLIISLGLQNKVIFTGELSEIEMCNYYLNSNVFVCPSSIENSPNSLGEAQLLGIPCVASFVGGVPDFMKKSLEYLYRFEDIDMLASLIISIFEDTPSYDYLRKNRELALSRHDQSNNTNNLIQIYNSL